MQIFVQKRLKHCALAINPPMFLNTILTTVGCHGIPKGGR